MQRVYPRARTPLWPTDKSSAQCTMQWDAAVAEAGPIAGAAFAHLPKGAGDLLHAAEAMGFAEDAVDLGRQYMTYGQACLLQACHTRGIDPDSEEGRPLQGACQVPVAKWRPARPPVRHVPCRPDARGGASRLVSHWEAILSVLRKIGTAIAAADCHTYARLAGDLTDVLGAADARLLAGEDSLRGLCW